MSDPKPNGLILERKIRKTNKVRTGVQFRPSVTQQTPEDTSLNIDVQATRVNSCVAARRKEREKRN
jgi:hypothetical protein